MDNNKLNFNTIKSVFDELLKIKPITQSDFKCGSLFYRALLGSCSEVTVKGIPFKDAVINPELFGIKVILDETLPADVARIGNDFFKLK